MEGISQGERKKVASIHGYTPGAPVEPKKKRKSDVLVMTTKEQGKRKGFFLDFPPDLLVKMIEPLVESKAPMSVILLSMVNKQCHQAISGDLRAWYQRESGGTVT